MSVIVHLRDGTNQQLPNAVSCAWQPAVTEKLLEDVVTRWLVCTNARGEVVAEFKEPDILGYKIEPAPRLLRFRLPRFRGRVPA